MTNLSFKSAPTWVTSNSHRLILEFRLRSFRPLDPTHIGYLISEQHSIPPPFNRLLRHTPPVTHSLLHQCRRPFNHHKATTDSPQTSTLTTAKQHPLIAITPPVSSNDTTIPRKPPLRTPTPLLI